MVEFSRKKNMVWHEMQNNINISPRKGEASWNSYNHNLELLVQILQGEFFFPPETVVDDISDKVDKDEKSAEAHQCMGFLFLWYFRNPFQRANGWQIGSVQMCVHATYTYEGPLVLKTSYTREKNGSIWDIYLYKNYFLVIKIIANVCPWWDF